MSDTEPSPRTPTTAGTPRAVRGAAAVIARYIQDLTHPTSPASGSAAA